ncbi:NrdR family transcriptional regulator, partial [Corynebacterium propinquum]
MYCPFCHHEQSRVVDSRLVDGGVAIRRRRECTQCQGRFTTVEKSVLLVVKRNGLTEPFSRDKL